MKYIATITYATKKTISFRGTYEECEEWIAANTSRVIPKVTATSITEDLFQ